MFWLLIVLLILWAVMIPVWPYHSRYGYGYYPFGVLSLILLAFFVLWFVGLFAVTV